MGRRAVPCLAGAYGTGGEGKAEAIERKAKLLKTGDRYRSILGFQRVYGFYQSNDCGQKNNAIQRM